MSGPASFAFGRATEGKMRLTRGGSIGRDDHIGPTDAVGPRWQEAQTCEGFLAPKLRADAFLGGREKDGEKRPCPRNLSTAR